MNELRNILYKEICDQVDDLGHNEKMALCTHILSSVDPNYLVPARNWQLTRQGGSCDVLTVNITGTVANMHAEGTISFKETDMPRSKLGRSYFDDTGNK